MKFRNVLVLRLRILALAVCLVGVATQAQTASRISQPLDLNARVSAHGSVPPQISGAEDLGRVSPSRAMKDILLRLSPGADQAASLQSFLADVQDRNSLNYQHWLTAKDFADRFSVSDADLQKITAWLAASGFTIEEVSAGKRWIRFSGTAAQVEQTFQTEIHSYRKANATHFANAKEVSIPAAFAPVVSGLVSLNSFEKAPQHTPVAKVARTADGKLSRIPSMTAKQPAGAAPATDPQDAALTAHPNFTSPGAPEETFLAPGDFSRIYNTASLLTAGTDGAGVSIAIVGRSDISLSDVEAFRTLFRLPFNDPRKIYVNGNPGLVPGDEEEAILDTEWSGAVAPKATIHYVIASSTDDTDGVDIASAYIVDHVTAPIMSVSFGTCEQGLSQNEIDFYHDLWQQASAEGITVLVSSGDSGSSSCDVPSAYLATPYPLGVNALASTPYNVAVGGTEFADTNLNTYWAVAPARDQSTAKGYIPETVWNESCNPSLPISLDNCYFSPTSEGTYAGGGGASSCSVHPDGSTPGIRIGLYACQSGYPKPAWQVGRGVPQDGVRDLPDVSLAAAGAHDGYLICFNGSCQWTTNPDGSFTLEQAAVVGGTSAASPSMAGIMALVEEKNGTFQGQADYKLYDLAQKQGTSGACNASTLTDPSRPDECVFHDVTGGANTLSCVFGNQDCTVPAAGSTLFGLLSGYSATPGYDLASGLGSVNAANLVKAWSSLPSSETSTTLSVSRTHFVHGAAVTVASHVTPAAGAGSPTGEIALLVERGSAPTGPVFAGSLVSGSFQQSINSLPGGTYKLLASYGGDAHFDASTSAPVTLTVAPEADSLTVGTFIPARFIILGRRPYLPGDETALGNLFYVQVQVTSASGAGTATGNIELLEGAKHLGTYPLDNTGAIYVPCGPNTPCDLARGQHNLTARYTGDSSFTPSTSNFPFIVDQGLVNIAAGLSAGTAPAGSTVIASVDFAYDPIALPTGRVTLTRDDTGAVLAVGSVGPNGAAIIPFRAQPGSYNVVPAYAGDANYQQGVLESYQHFTTEITGAASTTIAVTLSSLTSSLGASTQVNVAVSPVKKSASFPTGTVTLHMINGSATTPFNLIGGHVSTFIPWSTAGPQTFYATYDGDPNFAGSNSPLLTVQVAKATPALALQARKSVVRQGVEVSLSALLSTSLSPAVVSLPTGLVQLYDSWNGAAARPLGQPQTLNTGNGDSLLVTIAPVLGVGSHMITALYEGDNNWTRAEGGPINVQVLPSAATAPTVP